MTDTDQAPGAAGRPSHPCCAGPADAVQAAPAPGKDGSRQASPGDNKTTP
ncbi:hypothetical protein [Mesorhizobium sp. ES1-1]|nr:hypothetical protein [Mesorhizobium sp. ES1-1]MBZ9678726.1 hypothetical protein [Mesorhizobium sp. ES1-1]